MGALCSWIWMHGLSECGTLYKLHQKVDSFGLSQVWPINSRCYYDQTIQQKKTPLCRKRRFCKSPTTWNRKLSKPKHLLIIDNIVSPIIFLHVFRLFVLCAVQFFSAYDKISYMTCFNKYCLFVTIIVC